MALLLKNVKLPLSADESSLKQLAARALAVSEEAIRALRVVRISTDARKKEDIYQLYTLRLELSPAEEKRALARGKDVAPAEATPSWEPKMGTAPLRAPVAVVGLGPAGLCAAYWLAACGYRPIVLERGRAIETRQADVARFCAGGPLDYQSNVMFGEGGAGAFSDGKLVTRIKDPRAALVLELFARFGAPQEILVQAKPHVGTDKLRLVVGNLRREIVRLGGEVRFESTMTALETADGTLRALRVQGPAGEYRLPCSACVLAIGQGARDTITMLHAAGMELVPKAFAVGVRIEHPREWIDRAQFGRWAGNPRLGAAEYHLSEQAGGRGVYTFCMCPGGVVIPSASGPEQVVTNGMSDYARDAENSNAAIVVQVDARDFGEGPLAGMHFQERLEHDAFLAGGGDGCAPVCCAGDFLAERAAQKLGAVRPTYRPGVRLCDLSACLPPFISEGIRQGIRAFDRRLQGFAMQDAVLTAVESRTSAPVRILRDERGEATRCRGLFPVGEGAGYAGGIVSAGVDGLQAAERIIGRYNAHDSFTFCG